MTKLHELHFELLPYPPYFPDLAPSDYYLFADLKRMLQGERFGSNEEVIIKTEACFESKDKLFYTKGIEMLEKDWNECTRSVRKVSGLPLYLRTGVILHHRAGGILQSNPHLIE